MRNVIEAKFNLLTLPIAKRVLPSAVQPSLNAHDFFLSIVGHELAHGLTYHFHGENFLDLGNPVEESKADVAGLVFLHFLAKRNELPLSTVYNAVIIHVADMMRQVRFGLDEAHARGALIQYQWLREAGALRYTKSGFEVDCAASLIAYEWLNAEFYRLTQTKSYDAVQEFIARWAIAPDALHEIALSLADLPIDIDPIFESV